MDKPSLKRLFRTGIIASLVISALAGIVVLLKGSIDDTDWRVLGTTLAIGIFSITSLANVRNLDSARSSRRLYSVASILTSVLAFVVIAGMIWGSFDWDHLWQVALTLTILAVSSAHVSLLLPSGDKPGIGSTLVTLTVMAIVLVASMLIYLVTGAGDNGPGELFYRLLGVFAILDVLGTIISAITGRTSKDAPIV